LRNLEKKKFKQIQPKKAVWWAGPWPSQSGYQRVDRDRLDPQSSHSQRHGQEPAPRTPVAAAAWVDFNGGRSRSRRGRPRRRSRRGGVRWEWRCPRAPTRSGSKCRRRAVRGRSMAGWETAGRWPRGHGKRRSAMKVQGGGRRGRQPAARRRRQPRSEERCLTWPVAGIGAVATS
jgi:hypothetical protein